jgi:hypothetical protein
MRLSLLLDENISPVVAEQVRAKRPDIAVQSIRHWQGGAYRSSPDETVLAAAHSDGLTLVTYDTQILSELYFLFDAGTPFSGLVFIDEKTIPSNDFGGLVRALIHLWDAEQNRSWQNRLMYLAAPPAVD